MAVQGQSGKTGSDSILPSSHRISLDVGAASTRSIQPRDRVTSAEEYALKVRKPYTISKQRERWTDEEHKKFLEALKLYGRAWRRIEEHVGSKTAVQIRSHAQKFFSKVVRESNDGEASSVKPIEIPPPRPKRKPTHPYPRKSAVLIKSGCPEPEKLTMSVSPNVSVSELENQSPTSVLSALGTSNSTILSGSLSPVSSNVGGNSVGFVLPEPPNFVLEESRSSPSQANASSKLCNQACVASKPENQARVKVELFTQDDAFVKEGSAEASSTQCLKLFGKTMLVTESHKPSSPTSGMCKVQTDVKDETALPTVSWNFMPVKFIASDSECASSALTLETAAPFYYWPSQNESSRSKNGVCPAILPWGLSFSSASFPCLQVHNPIPIKGRPLLDGKDLEDKENQKEGSSTGSNTESVSAETSGDKNFDIEARGGQHPLEKAGKARSTKRMRGFVPYKRCLAERVISSSTLMGKEREDQRTRLCL